MDLQGFINKYTGKIVADPWGNYKGECVSLCKQWLAFNGWPMLRGNAINWQYNGDGRNYRFYRNYAWTLPKPGDIAVSQVGYYGHIGIVISGNVQTMRVFNQNWPSGNNTDPAKITVFDYRKPKCLGFLRKI
jgi:surface antigen